MSKAFKILSIDGGGIKGLYSSTILEHLEKKYDCSLSDYFDLICGTSTGGLIALGLSLKIPASEISKIYIDHGKKIFRKRTKLGGTIRQTFYLGKFTDIGLKKVLKDVFKERKLSDSNNLLCIPSYSYTDARPWVFKYGNPELTRDNEAYYVDVALATSAAPTFFPLAEISYYDHKQFIDGGVWANNPSLVGLTEALRFFVGEGRSYNSIEILSISSLNNPMGKQTGRRRRRSFIGWKSELFETSMIGQSHFSHHFLEQVSKISNIPITYKRILSESVSAEQQKLVQLDLATKNAINLIRGKGNDCGEIASKDADVSSFFKHLKTYNIK